MIQMNFIIESHVNTIQKRVQNIGKKVLIENYWAYLKLSFLNIMDVSPHQHFFVTELFLKVKNIFKIKIFSLFKWWQKRFFEKGGFINRMLF